MNLSQNKSNLFIIFTDYQFLLAYSSIVQFIPTQEVKIIFFYRNSGLIDIVKDLNFSFLHLIHGQDLKMKKNNIFWGVINELNRITNLYKALKFLEKKKYNRIFVSNEELQTLSLITKSIDIDDYTIIHLEEGNAVNFDLNILDERVSNSNKIQKRNIQLLKALRDKLRRLYFRNPFSNSSDVEEYGKASFYNATVVLRAEKLLPHIVLKPIIVIDDNIFLESLSNIFSFSSSLVKSLENTPKILLIIADGEPDKKRFDIPVLIFIFDRILKYAESNKYKVLIKKHPLFSDYVSMLNLETNNIIVENYPVEYYLHKFKKNLIVVGGSSTSLKTSTILKIPTYSFNNVYNQFALPTHAMTKEFLDSIGVLPITNLINFDRFN